MESVVLTADLSLLIFVMMIPISALQAVNKLLNDGAASISKNIHVHGSAHVSHGNTGSAHSGSVAGSHSHVGSSNIAAGAAGESHVRLSQESSQFTEPRPLTPAAYTGQKPAGLYDNIFNIPITALRSVNQLLNG